MNNIFKYIKLISYTIISIGGIVGITIFSIKTCNINISKTNINEYINGSTYYIYTNFLQIVQNSNMNYIAKYDSTRGEFTAKALDISFELKRFGNYGEDIEIKYNYGYGGSMELAISRFDTGEYKTQKSEMAINMIVSTLDSLLHRDLKDTNKITGKIIGIADGIGIKKYPKKYNGDLGPIINYAFFYINNKVDTAVTLTMDNTKLDCNIYFAFLRAYDLKRSLDRLKDSKEGVIEANSIKIHAQTYSVTGKEYRKVEALLFIRGALKRRLDSLNKQEKDKIAKIYSAK